MDQLDGTCMNCSVVEDLDLGGLVSEQIFKQQSGACSDCVMSTNVLINDLQEDTRTIKGLFSCEVNGDHKLFIPHRGLTATLMGFSFPLIGF